MTKRVLITAANGMGPHVIAAFQEAGHEVFAIARDKARKQAALAKSPDLPADHILVQDFTVPAAQTPAFWQQLINDYKIDGVVNNAMVTPKNSITRPQDRNQERTWLVNEHAATALFEACAQTGVPVIQQSTHNAHVPNNKTDAYRKSKNAARIALQRLVHEKSLTGVVVELGMVTVPGGGYYRLEHAAEMPFKLKLLQKPGFLQPIVMEDVTQGMVGIMRNLWERRNDRVASGHVYQAAGEKPMRLQEYINGIAKAMGIENRVKLPVVMPLRLAHRFMRVTGKLPIYDFMPFDHVDMLELRRDFSVAPEGVAAFKKAGNLAQLQDPFSVYSAYAKQNPPYNGVGALLAQTGIDVQHWWRSLKNKLPHNDILPVHTKRARPASRVLAVGATGFMGPRIVEELVAAGHEVVCVVRNPEKARKQLNLPGVTFITADLNLNIPPQQWKTWLQDYKIDTIVNNAGIEKDSPGQSLQNINIKAPLNLIAASAEIGCESGKPKRFIQISTGFLTNKDSEKFDYPRSKKTVETALAQSRDLDWVVVRPNYVYEPGRGHIVFENLSDLPLLAFVKDGAKQPICNRDLAVGIACIAARGNTAHKVILEAAGTESLTWKGMLERVNDALGRTQPMPRIPYPLAAFAAAANQHLPQAVLDKIAPYLKVDSGTLTHLDHKVFKMLCMGTQSNATEWIKYTGFTPATIAEVYRAWKKGPAAYEALYEAKRVVAPAKRRRRNSPKI